MSTVKYNSSNFTLFTNLAKDAGRFAAYKDNEILYNLAQMANSSNSPEEFKAQAMPLLQKYKNYLDIEKADALASSQMAKKWQGFKDNADLYPNLEYRAVMDNRTREAHAKLNGLVLPINHKFWLTNYPPNGYGCRCSVVQTDKKADESAPGFTADKGFDFNPGINQRLFSESAGYYKATNKSAIDKLANTLLNSESRKFGFNQVGNIIRAKGLGDVKITKRGYKEAINQPHADYFTKNAALANMQGLLTGNLNWIEVEYTGKDLNVKAMHFAKITINGVESYLVVKELYGGEFQFYSMVDKIKTD